MYLERRSAAGALAALGLRQLVRVEEVVSRLCPLLKEPFKRILLSGFIRPPLARCDSGSAVTLRRDARVRTPSINMHNSLTGWCTPDRDGLIPKRQGTAPV